MGLDITAAASVELIKAMGIKEWNSNACDKYDDGHTWFLWNHDHVRDRGAPLVDGVYRLTGEQFGFCAGSYTSYNIWREWLARMVGIESLEAFWRASRKSLDTGVPFARLIDFPDNEGFMAAPACAALAADFVAHKDKATEFAKTIRGESNASYFLRAYANWSKAFALAATSGVVIFH